MGYFYWQVCGGDHPRTIPLIPAGGDKSSLSLVVANEDFNLPHEITHAVQYCFIPFWEVPKEEVEIPAMMVETMVRRKKGVPFPPLFLRKQAALALADLLSSDPEEFNRNFETWGKFKDAGHIASRFWHYSNYDKKYYSYVLGLLSERESALPGMVRYGGSVEYLFPKTVRQYTYQPSG